MLTTLETPAAQRDVRHRAAPSSASPSGTWTSSCERADAALLALGRALQDSGYRWTCVTPDTQAIVNARPGNEMAHDLRSVFGWSRAFRAELLPAPLLALLREAGALETLDGGLLRSRLRFSSFFETLLAHSAWPTTQPDAVFFGPDSYRFAGLVERVLAEHGWGPRSPGQDAGSRPCRVVDLGCGSGAGGILAARLIGEQEAHVLFTDINAEALRLAAVNARLAGMTRFECRSSDVLAAVDEPIDLVLANPPYLLDTFERAYRHGGGALGTGLALRIADEALCRLAPGGRLILYTAAPIVHGIDTLWRGLQPLLARAATARGAVFDYVELDPDVFGSELTEPAYAEVERLAVVGLTVQVR